MAQFQADIDILTTADSGPRKLSDIRLGIFHTTENSDSTSPDAVAKWQQDPANGSSYNVIFGTDGRVVRVNDDNYKPWAAGPTANAVGVHGSAIGRAARTREQWIAFPEQIEAMARWAANVHTEYGVPLRWLTAEQVRAGSWGFCGHAEISAAWKEVDHWDPGNGFPHDLILHLAKEFAAAGKGLNMSSDVKSVDKRPVEDQTLDQLLGFPHERQPGWEQLGGRSLVDAVGAIGAALGLDGFRDTRSG